MQSYQPEAQTKAIGLPGLAVRLRAHLSALWPQSGAAQAIAALDGLRGIAVLLTVVYHLLTHVLRNPNTASDSRQLLGASYGWWAIGASGVHLFFVLSGFLLFLPYARALVAGGQFPTSGRFYVRRALRILPAYWASLLLIVLLFRQDILSPAGLPTLGWHLLLLHNVDSVTFTAISTPFWTLAIEWQFYLLLPLIALGLRMLAQRWGLRAVAAALLGLIASSPAASLLVGLLIKPRVPHLAAYFSILELGFYLSVFALGMACALLYVLLGEDHTNDRRRTMIAQGGLWLGSGLLAAIWLLSGVPEWRPRGFWAFEYSLLGAGYAGLLLATLLHPGRWRRMLSHPALIFIGLISYSLYIWNWPIYEYIIAPIAAGFVGLPAILSVAFGLSWLLLIPFAWMFYHMVERPFIAVRRIQPREK